jgi:hypothetical protein
MLDGWNDGPAKSAIVDFVTRVTETGGADFVPPAERIATFDNDGTLWCEQPVQVQVFFLIDRVKDLAANDPTIKDRQPFKALLEHDAKTLHALGKQGIQELFFATHAGMTADAFDKIARECDREAKVANIGLHIGRRPLLAFGNSDGDLAMLRYANAGSGARRALLLHHDDDEREVAYDREFRLSPLAEALDRAEQYGITIVSMRRDWKRVFPATRPNA